MKRKALRTKTLLAFYRRFPPIDLRRSLKHEERTAMNSRILERRVATLEAAQKDASGTERGTEAAFRVDLRPGFQWPQVEVARTEGDDRRRSRGVERGENRILGGSDPTLSGLGAAQRLRRRGSLPPKLSNRIPRSVAGRVVGQAVRNSESHQPEENNIWP